MRILKLSEDDLVYEPMAPGALCGSIRGAIKIKNALPLFHGSQGCEENLYASEFFTADTPGFVIPILPEVYLPSTIIDQQDTIYGAEDRLRDAILEITEKYKPELIVIISSDVSELIGEDLEGIVEEVKQEKPHLNALVLHSGSLKGDHIAGYKSVIVSCIQSLMVYGERINDTVNLIGLMGNEVSNEYDLAEIKRLLKLLGLKVNASLIFHSNLNEIRSAPKAALNIVLNEEIGLEPAKLMKEKFGTPYIADVFPFGLHGTSEWINRIGAFFGKEVKATEIIVEERKRIDFEIRQSQCFMLIPINAAVCADPTFAIGFSKILKEIGITPDVIALRSTPGDICQAAFDDLKIDDEEQTIMIKPNLDDYIEEVKKLENVFCSFGSYLDYMALQDVTQHNVELVYPAVRIVKWEEPIMGFNGIVSVAKKTSRLYTGQNM